MKVDIVFESFWIWERWARGGGSDADGRLRAFSSVVR